MSYFDAPSSLSLQVFSNRPQFSNRSHIDSSAAGSPSSSELGAWRRGLWFFLLCLLVLWTGGRALAEDADEALPTPHRGPHGSAIVGLDDEMSLPTLRLPTLTSTSPLQSQPDLLPEGATARYPAQDGDGFYVRLEPRLSGEAAIEEIEFVHEGLVTGLGFRLHALELSAGLSVEEPILNVAAMALDVGTELAGAELEEIDQHLLQALLAEDAADDALANEALLTALGMDLETYRQELTAPGRVVTYLQTVGGVPVEQAGLHIRQRHGWTPDSVSGALYDRVRVESDLVLDGLSAQQVSEALAGLELDGELTVLELLDGPDLMLVPYGVDQATGEVLLRHAWRSTVQLDWQGEGALALLHVDAEDGSLLAFKPWQGHATVPATGKVYRRGPDVGPVTADFEVDTAVAGEYVLQLLPHIRRVDMAADNLFFTEVAIPEVGSGSSPSFANFDQAPHNDHVNIECNIAPSGRGFEEVNLFQSLYRNRQVALTFGIWQPFPQASWTPRVSFLNTGQPVCQAYSSMLFEACQGFVKPNCPNFSGAFIHHAHDRTVIAHEAAHHTVPRLTEGRPFNWCGGTGCPLPEGWDIFHDLADFWAAHVENTPCTGGWTAKNFLGGANGSFNCSPLSDEGGLLPREHEVATPFDPTDPADHFPEHGDLSQMDYAFGQVAAAALWQTRVGMRSRNRVAGHTLFWSRFQRALRFSGFANFNAPPASDRYLYQLLYDLESQMMDEWNFSAQFGSTSNKLTSGFARAGLFLIPPVCLDNDGSTVDARFCPNGENGGAAVIDIDDNMPSDDLTLDGVLHRETDYLEIGGVAPSFDVWTGPRWQFNGNTARPVTAAPQCNNRYWVEVSLDPAFASGPNLNSSWITVDTDVSTPASPECYGRWTPTSAQWASFTATVTPGSRVYYRVYTIDANGSNLMRSDQPGRGLWQTANAYAVMTTDGRFARFRQALGMSTGGGGAGSGQ